MPPGCPPEDRLARMLDDSLEADEAAAVEAHVSGCPACQGTLERLTAGEPDPTESIWSDPPTRPTLALATWAADARPAAEPARDPAPAEPSGYRFERELGRGGMGVVYLAHQVHANRLVALKMVLAGRGRPEDLLRFRLEGESLARLQHPNIVQVYEVGASEGRPFFSMEYVEGGTLAEVIAEAPRSPSGAAALAETLARAVHAAHQCGVVHRDLKPANVLLSGPSGSAESRSVMPAGTPKITDFGLAKQVGSDSGLTHTGQILGTPSYMAPEQATGGANVGIPADVYALGAILYELLAGCPPFRGDSPWETMMRAVHEPAAPPSRSRPGIPRDLEVICLKCLAKDPAGRYASADAMAEDLRRFRAGEPILARPASLARRARLWCRRNPLPAALAASLVASALAGAVAVGWSWSRAARERSEKALVADYLADRVLAESSAEVNPRGVGFTVRELLDRVGSRIGGDFQGHPEIEASIRETVGKSYLSLGAYAQAEPHLRAARALDVELRGPGDPAALRVANLLALLLEQSGRAQAAEALLRDNVAACLLRLGGDDPTTLEAEARLGALLRSAGKAAEAEPLVRSALDARRRVLPPDHPDTLRSVRDLCLLEVDRRRLEAAAALADEYERGIRCARGPKHPDNVAALANLGLIRLLQGHPDQAEPFYRRAEEEARRILGDDHAITRAAVAEHARVAALAPGASPP